MRTIGEHELFDAGWVPSTLGLQESPSLPLFSNRPDFARWPRMNKLAFAALGLSLLTCSAIARPVHHHRRPVRSVPHRVAVHTPPATAPGPDFLVRNAAAKGVVSTRSGLQYYVVKSGRKGGRSPVSGDNVTFDYEGKLTTGETFDSSFARRTPLTGGIDDFVPGFTEALELMRPGDEWIVWIPPALGYGAEASGPIPANSVLRFRMVLHKVTPATP